MTPRELHREAMIKVQLAYSAKERENYEQYQKLILEALSIEKEAANALLSRFDAEPTRSVLFRSAASLAIECGEFKMAEKLIFSALSGNPPVEVENELMELYKEASLEHVGENNFLAIRKSYAYLDTLRDNAINIKIEPKGVKFLSAVNVEYILDVLKNIKTSFSGFFEVNFERDYGINNELKGNVGRMLRNSPLLISNLKFRSFGASISSDTLMNFDQNPSINDWKKTIFERFKAEVIYFNYDSEEALRELKEKYSDSERRTIFAAFVDSLKESNGYKLQLTDKSFQKVEKSFEPLGKEARSILKPKTAEEKQKEEMELYQLVGMKPSHEESIKKRDVIFARKLEYAEFSFQTSKTISHNERRIFLNNEMELKVEYRQGEFVINLDLLGIYLSNRSYDRVVEEFNKAFVDLYYYLCDADEDVLNESERSIKEILNELVSSRIIE